MTDRDPLDAAWEAFAEDIYAHAATQYGLSRDGVDALVQGWCPRIEAEARAPLEAEIERLRAALEVISDGRHPDGHRGAVVVARAALEEPTQ